MRKYYLLFPFAMLLIMSACTRGHIYEKYQDVTGWEWKYGDAKSFPLDIKEDGKHYNIYINLRHTEDYKFSNLWVQLNIKKPGNQEDNQRFALTLAEQDGKWLGTRLGNIYDIPPFLVLRNYSIPKKGQYNFILSHAMREDAIQGIMDVGIRVEQVD